MNLRLLATLGGSLTAAAVLASCAAGPVGVGTTISEDRAVGDVTAVALRVSGALTITTGDEPTLTVTAGDKVIDQITSEVRDGVLVLDSTRGSLGSRGKLSFTLVLPAVEEIRVEGSGSADAYLTSADDLTLMVEGSGDIVVRGIEVEDLTVAIEGSGAVDLTGSAEHQSVTIEGSGGCSAAALETNSASVAIDGSGEAEVDVSGSLVAYVEGSGSITHSGGASVTSRIVGSGSIDEA